MSEKPFVSSSVVQKWIAEKLDKERVEQQLKAQGFGEEVIEAYLSEFSKQKILKKQEAGFIVTGVGAFLGFLSCVLTLTNPIPELFNIILYGLTSLSMIVIFLGLYLIFE